MLRMVCAVCLSLCTISGQAAHIYLCKTSQGATYWASDWCRTTGGYTVDAVSVPDRMPFEAQVKMAEQLTGRKQSIGRQADQAIDNVRSCRAIDAELAEIWKRYGNWQFNENAQIARDQARTRELKTQRTQLRCETY